MCPKLTEIPKELVKLRLLDIGNTNIKEIPKELVNLTELDCSECKGIKEIPKELVNLTELDCSHTSIKEIPKELVNLRKLTTDNCQSITTIPELPKLTTYSFSDCPNLTYVHEDIELNVAERKIINANYMKKTINIS
jgi:Leucine-rich repeat (LRR) protein